MARIRIYRYEASGEDFPRLCMRCGRPAECDVPQKFAWMPVWANALIVLICIGMLGLVLWIIAAVLTRKTMRIIAPMCLQHAGHWRVRKLYTWLGLLFWCVVGVGLVVLSDHIPKDAMGPVVLCGMGGALAWLLSAGIFMNNAIRAAEIRDKDMQLVNVNKDFADAWNDMFE